MEYTVAQLARLAGVSVRTLRWYDHIGLLRPARVTPAGYRMYGPAEVDALQDILFYRALDVPLKTIAALTAGAPADRLALLRRHRAALEKRRAQLDGLLETLDKTIRTQEGKATMTDNEKFAHLRDEALARGEALYGTEARTAYGDEAVAAQTERLRGLTPEQCGAMQALGQEICAALGEAVRAGADPAGPEGQRIARLHRRWLEYAWPRYTPQAHRGVAELYVQDARFTAYYDEAGGVPGCAAFLRGAVAAFTADSAPAKAADSTAQCGAPSRPAGGE